MDLSSRSRPVRSRSLSSSRSHSWGQWIVLLAAVAFTGVEASSLAAALQEALMPVLTQMSSSVTMGRNHSDWTFAYTDAETSVSFCAGYSDLVSKTHCSANDTFAWGSTTKVMTATLILQMVEDGKFGLDDSIVPNANPFLNRISNGTTDLVTLYGPLIWDVSIRHLLQMSSGIQEYDDAASTVYQNTHRGADLSPVWVLNNSNRTFVCEPGSCGLYSSTNYVLLGLVLSQHSGVSNWDKLDQTAWTQRIKDPTLRSRFNGLRYAVHGLNSDFSTSDSKQQRGSTIHGYQRVGLVLPNQSDVFNMSSTQGWTCGNLETRASVVSDFFYALLGPERHKYGILKDSSLATMLDFKTQNYFGRNRSAAAPGAFGYGLGMMNFTSMDWGFANHGLYYGHNGLTYGFGAQSGFNFELNFSATWVNNVEEWIGPDDHGKANQIYEVLVGTIKKHRASKRN